MIRLRLFKLFFLCLCFYSSLSAQDNFIRFEHVYPTEELKQNYYLSLFQDKDGFLWLGTYSALYRFNGYSVKTFVPTDDTTTISNPSVHSIFQEKSGVMWFGTEGGLNKYDPSTGKFTRIVASDSKNSLSHNYIKCITQDVDGSFWIATYGGGLNHFDSKTGTFKIFKKEPDNNNSLPSNRVNTVYIDRKGEVWIGTESGLSRFDKDNGEFQNFQSSSTNYSLSDNIITSILEDEVGNFWVGTWRGGLNLFDRESQKFSQPKIQNNKSKDGTITIRSIIEDKKGNLWLGTFGKGLIYFDPKNSTYKTFLSNQDEEKTLSNDYIWSLLLDRSGILWIGTAEGLNKFDKNRHKFPLYKLSKKERVPVVALHADRQDQLWIGSQKGILAKFDKGKNSFQFFLKGKLNSNIKNMTEDKNGILWLGTDAGLIKFNPQDDSYSLLTEFNNDPKTSRIITSLHYDKKGNLWFGVYDNGLFKIDAEYLKEKDNNTYKFIQYKNDPNNFNSLSSNIIWSINEDSEGYIWIATDSRIDRLNVKETKFSHYGGYSYSSIYQNSPGIIWIGSYGKGIAKLTIRDGKLEYFDSSRGLIHGVVSGIVGDDAGNLWISTVKGISKFDPIRNKFQNFDVADGLQGIQFLLNSACKLSTGELAFGGNEGFNLFNPNNVVENFNHTPVVITDIKLFNKSLSWDSLKYKESIGEVVVEKTSELRLTHLDNVFSIEFAALNFGAPQKQRYQYKLEGFDKDWVTTEADNRIATYTNLDPGTYYFKVKAVESEGISVSEVSNLKISISPPFYKTIFFKGFLLFLFMLFGVFAYKKRIDHLKEQFFKGQLKAEQELIKLKNEKLDSELDVKSKELTTRTMNLLHKNEKIIEIRNSVLNTIPKAEGKVLSDLQSILKSIDKEIRNDSHWDQFEFHFNDTHDNFLKRFKEAYPILTHNDLRICAYMRMNLNNHEIASLLNITVRAVETSRYRIRKKIMLNNPISLTEFILRF